MQKRTRKTAEEKNKQQPIVVRTEFVLCFNKDILEKKKLLLPLLHHLLLSLVHMSSSLQTYALLESIQQQVWHVQQNMRKDISSEAIIVNVLDELDIIINRSYDQHTTIGIDTLTVDTEDDGMKATYHDLQTAKRIASNWLIRLISSGELGDELTDRAAQVLAHFSGRGGKRS